VPKIPVCLEWLLDELKWVESLGPETPIVQRCAWELYRQFCWEFLVHAYWFVKETEEDEEPFVAFLRWLAREAPQTMREIRDLIRAEDEHDIRRLQGHFEFAKWFYDDTVGCLDAVLHEARSGLENITQPRGIVKRLRKWWRNLHRPM